MVALTNTQSDLENKPLADNKVSESGIENLTEQDRNTVSNGELTGQEVDTYGDETTSSDNTSITGSKVTEQLEINPFDIDIQEVKQPSVESSEDEKRQIGIAEIEADPAL
ncbi:hypothetical protein [Psychrosphaera algicola]|uniref:Uncharacterized protein n=1 Tax=Psychrosphaera algicola TaxID=3023714 RepID=A0ABT5FD25_9GAMM|nr:hypothetical protein [Psychrosphaera sp. G1-22]MDC2888954.1 hypothetical protein [Psychrosphaera sp. G1-22]